MYGLAGPFLADFASLKDFLPFVLDTGGSVKATLVRKFAEQGSKLVSGGVGSLGFTTGSILWSALSREVSTGTIPSLYLHLHTAHHFTFHQNHLLLFVEAQFQELSFQCV
jgi:hypothetical protein